MCAFVHSKAQPVVVGYSCQPVISLDHALTYGNKQFFTAIN